MSRHTSWHVGGPADCYFRPRDARRPRGVPAQPRSRSTPLIWIGLGSNLLVRDGGIRGVVIETHGVLTSSSASATPTVCCEAGVAVRALAKPVHQVGPRARGILRGHSRHARRRAGDERGRVRRRDLAARARRRDASIARGVRRERPRRANTCELSPRRAARAGEWFLAARLEFEHAPGVSTEDDARAARAAQGDPADRRMELRLDVHQSAGRSRRAADRSGRPQGSSHRRRAVSDKHANFIVNDGTASAADIEQLIGT